MAAEIKKICCNDLFDPELLENLNKLWDPKWTVDDEDGKNVKEFKTNFDKDKKIMKTVLKIGKNRTNLLTLNTQFLMNSLEIIQDFSKTKENKGQKQLEIRESFHKLLIKYIPFYRYFMRAIGLDMESYAKFIDDNYVLEDDKENTENFNLIRDALNWQGYSLIEFNDNKDKTYNEILDVYDAKSLSDYLRFLLNHRFNKKFVLRCYAELFIELSKSLFGNLPGVFIVSVPTLYFRTAFISDHLVKEFKKSRSNELSIIESWDKFCFEKKIRARIKIYLYQLEPYLYHNCDEMKVNRDTFFDNMIKLNQFFSSYSESGKWDLKAVLRGSFYGSPSRVLFKNMEVNKPGEDKKIIPTIYTRSVNYVTLRPYKDNDKAFAKIMEGIIRDGNTELLKAALDNPDITLIRGYGPEDIRNFMRACDLTIDDLMAAEKEKSKKQFKLSEDFKKFIKRAKSKNIEDKEKKLNKMMKNKMRNAELQLVSKRINRRERNGGFMNINNNDNLNEIDFYKDESNSEYSN